MNAPRCVICDYDLTGLPEAPRCPECGFVHPPFVARARLKATGGETKVTVVVSLFLIAAAFGGGLFVYTALVRWVIQAYGPAGTTILTVIYIAWLVGSFFLMPLIARRFAHPDSRWDDVLSVTEEGLALQRRDLGAPTNTTPWSMLKSAKLRQTRRGYCYLTIKSLLSQRFGWSFGLTYTIDAEGERAVAIHQAILDRIAQCRATSTK